MPSVVLISSLRENCSFAPPTCIGEFSLSTINVKELLQAKFIVFSLKRGRNSELATVLEIHLPFQELPQEDTESWEIFFSLPDFMLLSPSAVLQELFKNKSQCVFLREACFLCSSRTCKQPFHFYWNLWKIITSEKVKLFKSYNINNWKPLHWNGRS